MTELKKRTKDFKFKRFSVYGGFSGMPVSTDGVLLGAWIDSDQSNSILDIGTGTGLLTLMCAQRFPHAQMSAIEIDLEAYDAAKINFRHSGWGDQINLIHGDILQWEAVNPFDTIICNPPYFTDGEQSHSPHRATARHTDSLSHSQLLVVCKKLLAPEGKANFILPRVEGIAFISAAKSLGWSVSRLCQVAPTDAKQVSRLLIELSLKEHKTEASKLVIHQAGQYSTDFIALTKDFYLKM
ncbi:tRNA1(Val) (adenine(37)-N6)-methyltransferase [Vibrio sp. F74]|uniref:tRNA1(Val) (adenine(37)-N6)-methyltransferase n=1 Tax=Vibrio sp. F74 TaxID=700020 RepID=UPI0035F5F77E